MSFANALGQKLTFVASESYDGDRLVSAVVKGLELTTANTTATVTFNANGQSETVYNTSASTISSLSVTLPSVTVPGQRVTYYTHGTLTSVTLTGTVTGAAWTSGAADSTVSYLAIDNAGTFVRTR